MLVRPPKTWGEKSRTPPHARPILSPLSTNGIMPWLPGTKRTMNIYLELTRSSTVVRRERSSRAARRWCSIDWQS